MMGKKSNVAVKVKCLPEEIEENLLSRVPVKTILRFRSVCKSWYSLFLDPRFITMHQKNNPSNSNNLLLTRLHKSKELVVMDTSSVVHSRLAFDPLLGRFVHDDQSDTVVCCNGIVCVHGISDGIFSEKYIFMWNPALRVIKKIKICDHPNKCSRRAFVGFGFHSQSNDYKVVRFEKNIFSVNPKVDIYSLSSNSWRTVRVALPLNIRHFIMGTITCASGVYVNETHHWVVFNPRYEPEVVDFFAIVSFDMRDEMFKEILVPTELSMKTDTRMILFNYSESLGMLTFDASWYDYHDIWVMKDYGLPESWTKICKIEIPGELGRVIFRGFIQIRNELVFSRDVRSRADQERHIVFDIDKEKVNDASSIANIEILKDAIEVTTFRESLLLLDL